MTFKKIKFVTDSVADVPAEFVQKLDITVVPCFVNYGGNSYADDGVELIREDYYNELGNMPEVPTTAAMPPELARQGIDKAFTDADHVVIITTASTLSGIYNSMRLAISDLPPDQVTLIDSGQLSVGIGWQVVLGAEVAAETGDVKHTLAAVQAVREQQTVFAALDDLQYLRRSGRVSWAVASIGNLLQTKPVVQVRDGEVTPFARVRTMRRVVDKMAELIREQVPLDRLAILHVNNEPIFQELKAKVADVVPPDTVIGLINPALGTLIGPGSIGFAAVKEGWKDAISTGNTG